MGASVPLVRQRPGGSVSVCPHPSASPRHPRCRQYELETLAPQLPGRFHPTFQLAGGSQQGNAGPLELEICVL